MSSRPAKIHSPDFVGRVRAGGILIRISCALLLLPLPSFAESSTTFAPSEPNTTGMEEIEGASKDLRCGQECLYKRANENVLLQTAFTIIKYQKLQALPDDSSRARELGAYCAPAEGSSACFERYEREAKRILPELRGSASKSLGQIEKLGENSAQTLTIARPVGASPTPAGMLPYLPTLEQVKTHYDRNPGAPLDPRNLENHMRGIANPPRREDYVMIKEDTLPDGTKVRRPQRRQDGTPEIDERRFAAAMKAWEENRKGMITSDQKAFIDATAAAAKRPDLRQLDLRTLGTTDREAFLESRGMFFDALEKGTGGGSLSGRTPSSRASSTPPPRGGSNDADLSRITGNPSGTSASPTPVRMENGVYRPGRNADPNRDLNIEYPLEPVDQYIDRMQ